MTHAAQRLVQQVHRTGLDVDAGLGVKLRGALDELRSNAPAFGLVTGFRFPQLFRLPRVFNLVNVVFPPSESTTVGCESARLSLYGEPLARTPFVRVPHPRKPSRTIRDKRNCCVLY